MLDNGGEATRDRHLGNVLLLLALLGDHLDVAEREHALLARMVACSGRTISIITIITTTIITTITITIAWLHGQTYNTVYGICS